VFAIPGIGNAGSAGRGAGTWAHIASSTAWRGGRRKQAQLRARHWRSFEVRLAVRGSVYPALSFGEFGAMLLNV